jgi:hypothetical protein
MRREMVEEYLKKLSPSLGGVRPAVSRKELYELHQVKDFVGMVRHIRGTLKLQLGVRVGFVNSGGSEKTPAWVEMPRDMPLYGSKDFTQTTVTMYVLKSFLFTAPFDSIVTVIAHELSHIVLHGIRNELRYVEEAVDLTAMILGYRDFFCLGTKYTVPTHDLIKKPCILRLMEKLRGTFVQKDYIEVFEHSLGYLTIEEVLFARSIMDRQIGL